MKQLARGKRILTWLTSLVLVAGVLPGPVLAAEGPARAPYIGLKTTSGLQTASVDKAVFQLLDSAKEPITFLVKMRKQPDFTALRAEGSKRALSQNMTPATTKLTVREQVVQGMQLLAQESQADLVQQLDKLRKEGHVTKVESFYIVSSLAITGDKAAVEAIAKRGDVQSILPNKTVYLNPITKAISNQPIQPGSNAGDLGGAKPRSQAPSPADASDIGWNIQMVGAPAVWSLGYTGQGTVVGSIDTGVQWDHPALQRKFRGYDPSNPSVPNVTFNWFDATGVNQNTPYDDLGHGTHTMGTMVGSEADGHNQVGMAPNARWMAAKAFTAGGGTDVQLLAAGQWMLAPTDAQGHPHPEMAPDVINNSWGGGPGVDEWFRPMLQAWRAANIFPAFANGNAGPGDGSTTEPGNQPEAFAVGAVDANSVVAPFSSRGPSPYGEIKPEVSAPGVNVRSSVPGSQYQGGWSGTSMATPHVAGLVALLLSANASLTVDQMEQILTTTAVPTTDARYPRSPNNGYGYGIISAMDAVAAVTTGLGMVQGRVVRSGDDFNPPTASTTPVAHGYTGFPIHVVAQASDDVSIKSVTLMARLHGDQYWTCIDMIRTAGDLRSGTYEADIPGNLVLPVGTEYEIRVEDFGGNVVYLPSDPNQPYLVQVTNGVTPGYVQDFESDISGWLMDNIWQWGVPTSGPRGAHSGQKVMATNLSGDYPNGANAVAFMPPIDLTHTNRATLQFSQWYQLENGFDYAGVLISVDGQNWNVALAETGSGTSWQQASIDLTPYAGQRIFVAFLLQSDGSVTFPGWYVDDVAVVGPDTVPPAAPTGLQGSADANAAVTLNWTANSESDLGGYNIYRSNSSSSGYSQVGSATTPTFQDNTAPGASTLYYRVTALDIWGNESAPSTSVAVTTPNIAVLLNDDFESQGDNGWTHSGQADSWQHGTPTNGPGSAHSGTRLWATNLTGNYDDNMNASLVSPVIDLRGTSAASVSFASWYRLESCCDAALVEVTTNGGTNWTQLARYTGSSSGWTSPRIDLTPYVGNQVQIRLRVTSDSSVVFEGWYVDDVRVTATRSTSGQALSTQPSSKGKSTTLKLPLIKLPLFSGALKAQKVSQSRVDAEVNQGQPLFGSSVTTNGTTGGGQIQSLPVEGATVTVVETGRSVRVDPATGTFTLRHAAGTFTLRAEAYGYFSQDRTVNIPANGTVSANFVLEAVPHQHIRGTVTNSRTHDPIAGAAALVLEDGRVTPATTDSQGRYDLDVLRGTYTVRASAPGYYVATGPANATSGDVTLNLGLRPFIGSPGDLAYDDGSAENAWAFYQAGNAWAVRFTPTSDSTLVAGASFRFWDSTWPSPGGTDFQYAVFDASGDAGSPGHLLAGPFHGTAKRDGTWTDVDMQSLGLVVSGDFYIAMIQAADYPNIPGMGTDDNGPAAHRSWQRAGGTWSLLPDSMGNMMIRAHVLNPISAPVWTSPAQNPYSTGSSTVDLAGRSSAGALITLYRDGSQVTQATADSQGRFTFAGSALHGGQNVFTATATVATGTTDPSAEMVVIMDNQPPQLSVTSPVDNMNTNQQAVTVEGTVTDEHLASLTVNGQTVQPAGDGRFSTRALVSQGDNTITVRAVDTAGNATVVTRTVHVNWSAPAINNLQPASDVTLNPGQSLTVSFDGPQGLTASFDIVLPGSSQGSGTSAVTTKARPMSTGNLREVTPGHYEGTWTAPQGTQVQNANVVVHVTDRYGNRADATATGRVSVRGGGGGGGSHAHAQIARVFSPLPAGTLILFNGAGSSSDAGRIVRYDWDFGDGATGAGRTARHTYTQRGEYTVSLTVTDSAGNTDTTTTVVRIR